MKEYPKNLLEAVSIKLLENGIPNDIDGTVEYVLRTFLSNREADILRQRFHQGKTCTAIGKIYGLSSERIRKIEYTALRKLREPKCFQFLQKGVCGVISSEIENAVEKLNAEKQQKVVVKQEFGRYYNRDMKVMSLADVKAMELDELGLSSRSYNALKRAGLNTIGDVEKVTIKHLKKIRNLGRRSCEEITGKLNQLGITLREDDD